MKLVPIVAVFDSMQGFKNIAIVPNIDVGKRGFVNSCTYMLRLDNDESLAVSDLRLYHVGDFNLDTGEITPCNPVVVATPPTSVDTVDEVVS